MGMALFQSDGPVPPTTALPDGEIVKRVQAGDSAGFELLMRRHNQRVYRVVRAVVKDEADVEDVMQQAYINAFTHLHQFEDRSQFSTWLIRIAVHEAFGRRRKTQRAETTTARNRSDVDNEPGEFMDTLTSPEADPERQAYAQELHRVLEAVVDTLPDVHSRPARLFALPRHVDRDTKEVVRRSSRGDAIEWAACATTFCSPPTRRSASR